MNNIEKFNPIAFAKFLQDDNRSLTGEGTLTTLKKIQHQITGFEINYIKTGTKVFDWKVPKVWNVHKAFIKTPDGKYICDYKSNPLHLIGYSKKFSGEMNLNELKPHLHYLKNQPDALPYVTSYYAKRWGFAITYNEFRRLKKGKYQILIDTTHKDGYLNYGELFIRGNSKREILISTYVCHPFMANDNLSGIVVTISLAKWLMKRKNRYSYRIVFVPETIGALSFLKKNLSQLKKYNIGGFNVTCVGDNNNYSFLPSKYGDSICDRTVLNVLKQNKVKYKKFQWEDRGSDERQYCAPGVDLNIVSVMRSKYGEFPEYHTSLDDFNRVVTSKGIGNSIDLLKKCIVAMDKNVIPISRVIGEPMLGKYGLYETLSRKDNSKWSRNYMNIMSLCDGNNSVHDIACRLNISESLVKEIIVTLKSHNLVYFL